MLERCKQRLKNKPEDYELVYISGLIHENVTRIAFLQTYQKKTLDDILYGDFFVLPAKNAENDFLVCSAADILDTFPNAIAPFCPKSIPENYVFSMDDLYIFHCAISAATCRLLEYLEIKNPTL
ncbi:hypothetical protein [Victivallis lenta]|uniref:hypothetical protein n=1 Tax=Victivallis lenta TaxID=2606640 RepID=UPI003AB5F82D